MIRPAKASEIEKIITITQACAAHMQSQEIYQWNEFYPSKAAFETDLERGELFVLISSENPIGCITISTHKDEEYKAIDWLSVDSDHRYIHRLAVNPEAQGKGNAKRLMDFAEAKAQEEGAVSVRLDTFSKNLRNQKFYECRGYQRLGAIYFPKQSKHPFYCYELLLNS
tara:strand:+ start:302 stop:808 length:507 start_codon:yes stop_codon:yes gene_type:complete